MKKFASVLLLFVYATNLGCYSTKEIPPSEIRGADDKIVTARYRSGEVVEFQTQSTGESMLTDRDRTDSKPRQPSGARLDPETQTIHGTALGGELAAIPVGDLSAVRVQRFNTTKTLLWVVGIPVGIWVLAGLIYYGAGLAAATQE